MKLSAALSFVIMCQIISCQLAVGFLQGLPQLLLDPEETTAGSFLHCRMVVLMALMEATEEKDGSLL